MQEFQRYMSICSDSITTYTLFPSSVKKNGSHLHSRENLKKAYKGKHLTHNQAKKIKKILTNWILAINISQRQEKNKYKKKRRYLVMLTLTLPSCQIESDKEIKRNYLNNFLIQLKKDHANINYLWVAEKQKNGNIHFHIVVDRFVHKNWLNKHWNAVLDNGNYIEEFEKKFNHKMPPSAHVRGQKAMENPINYLIKYVTKSEKSLSIEGHKWACNKNLLQVLDCKVPFKAWYNDYLYYYRNELKIKYYENDFIKVYYFDGDFLNDVLYNDLFYDNETYLLKQYAKILPEIVTKHDRNIPTKINQKRTHVQTSINF